MGKLGGFVLGVQGTLASICSSLILTLQIQEAGLVIEPGSEFRETLRSDFSS